MLADTLILRKNFASQERVWNDVLLSTLDSRGADQKADTGSDRWPQ